MDPYTIAVKTPDGEFYYEFFSADDADHVLEQYQLDPLPVPHDELRVYRGKTKETW